MNNMTDGRRQLPAGVAHRRGTCRLVVEWALCAGALVLAASGCSASTASKASPSATPVVASSKASTTAAAVAEPVVPGRIAFRRYADETQTTGALFTSAADGSSERQLTRPPASALDDEPDWAPDGTRLLFTRITNQGTDHESHRLFTVSSDGTALTALGPDRPAQGDVIVGFDGTGAFSPDGKHIAFGYAHGKVRPDPEQIKFSDIVVMDADGSHRRQVTKSAAYAGDAGGVAWSPDGKRLVYARSNASASKPAGGRALFTVDIDGSHERQLTPWSVGADGTPDWSSTNLIAFRAVADEESGIGNFFTVHPDGTALTQITHFTDTVISHKVGFSPDGQWIVFAKAATSGSNDVFIAKADGSDLRPVTNTPLADSSADWGPPR